MFNQKEEGYDEFVAECVRKGLEDVEQGRIYTFAQSKAMARAVLARKAKENAEFEQEVLNYA